jgi:putative DNA primase/helicase
MIGFEALKREIIANPPMWETRSTRPESIAASVAAAKSAVNGGAPDLLPFYFNDSGNASRLIALYGDDLRYCHAFKKWLVWDQMHWVMDEADQARRLAKDTMVEFFRQASEGRNENAEKFARGSLDARRIANALSLAEPEIYVKPGDLDQDPYLLNFLNGTVDLRTGDLRPHDRNDLITKLVHYEYRPEAPCPSWRVFLDQIMGGGPDAGEAELARGQRLTDYLQRAFGYSLTGCTSEKAIFVLFGEGDNGKSTMLNTFRQLIEEYATLLQVDTLMVRQESNNTQADLADLRGARFAQTSEAEEGQRLSQGKLKRITQGMGKIRTARKYENQIEFSESHKLWMDTNHKPTIPDSDDKATFNRLHPIPFTVRIPKESIDREMPAKLLREAEGILAWAVAGAKLQFESGLQKPAEVETASQDWRADSDQLGRFVEERCVVGDGLNTPAAGLYAEYKRWAETGGEHPMTSRAFGTKLPDRGFSKKEITRGTVYLGIGLRAPETDR